MSINNGPTLNDTITTSTLINNTHDNTNQFTTKTTLFNNELINSSQTHTPNINKHQIINIKQLHHQNDNMINMNDNTNQYCLTAINNKNNDHNIINCCNNQIKLQQEYNNT